MTPEREQDIRENLAIAVAEGWYGYDVTAQADVHDLLAELSSLRGRVEQAEKALAAIEEPMHFDEVEALLDDRWHMQQIAHAYFAARAAVSAAPGGTGVKTTGWIVEWREEGFGFTVREIDFHTSRAAAKRAMCHEIKAVDHLPGQVFSLHRVTIDPDPALVLRSSAAPEDA